MLRVNLKSAQHHPKHHPCFLRCRRYQDPLWIAILIALYGHQNLVALFLDAFVSYFQSSCASSYLRARKFSRRSCNRAARFPSETLLWSFWSNISSHRTSLRECVGLLKDVLILDIMMRWCSTCSQQWGQQSTILSNLKLPK